MISKLKNKVSLTDDHNTLSTRHCTPAGPDGPRNKVFQDIKKDCERIV